MFDRSTTRSGEDIGFAKRTDLVNNWDYFDWIAEDCSHPLNGHEHRQIAMSIYKILNTIPEMQHAVDMALVKREIYIRCIHRTHIGDGTPINLTYNNKHSWP